MQITAFDYIRKGNPNVAEYPYCTMYARAVIALRILEPEEFRACGPGQNDGYS